ncbi:MAG TPA: LysR family transcriptional regulator [Ramlibacter sp.]|nr:LysR family transcriptional regulator [Ramlibacter sp.]
MKTTLQAGLRHTAKFEVTRDRTIDFMGEKARVYATPMLVRDVEIACRELLLAHLDAGEDSVGTRVEIDHLAATLMRMNVELDIELVEVKGRAVTFKVEGRDNVDTICRATHMRFIVDVASTEKRLAAKAAKAGLA